MSEALAFKGNVRSRLGAKQKKGKKAPIASVSASLNAPANEVALIAAKGSGKQETKKEQDKGNQGEKKKDVPVTSDGKVDVGKVFQLAVKRAFRGGAAGFAAGVVQVCTFMWLRTSMNYQYANGGTLGGAIKTLYKEGGLSRFYRGVNFAIMQAPLSRFGDTAANTGVLAFLEATTPGMPVGFQTMFASTCGSLWRIAIMPIDAYKTTLQVRGAEAFKVLKDKVATSGPGVLYYGAVANFTANWVGNYPWFVTFNFLQRRIPQAEGKLKLLRNALIGICSSCVSDSVSNSLRVLKTVKQTSSDANLGYVQAFRNVLATDGIRGLLGRGLATRLLVNICQSMVFTVAWKALQEELEKKAAKKKQQEAAKKD